MNATPHNKNRRAWIPGRDGLREYRGEKSNILISILAALGLLAIDLLKPWPLAWILDLLYQDPENFPLNSAIIALGLLLILNLGRSLLGAWREFQVIRVGLRGLRRVRERFFSNLLLWDFHEAQEREVEKTLYNAAWDTYSFQTQYQQWVGSLTEAVFSLLGMSVVMWWVQPKLAWIPMVAAPITVLWLRFAGSAMTDSGKTARESDANVTQSMGRAVQYLSLIQLFHQQPRQKKLFSNRSRTAERDRLQQHRKEITYSAGVGLVFGALSVAVVGMGAYLIINDALTPGELVVFLAYVSQWYGPLNQISQFGAVNADAQAGVQRVYEAMQPKRSRISMHKEVVGEGTARLQAPWCLEWRGLYFQYPGGRELFHGLNGHLETGKLTVCRGVSGIGKSTLARILTRWMDFQEGEIRLQGADIREWELDLLRQQFSWAPQRPLLGPGTVRDNLELASANPEIFSKSPDAIYVDALNQADAGNWLHQLSGGLDTLVGEPGGIALSDGERQRLCLARALIKPAPFLILDEPTSSLDEPSASRIVRNLRQQTESRAILVISHQSIWWEAADEVIEINAEH